MQGGEGGMNDIISKALANPAFSEIFSSLKDKVDKGELDVSTVLGAMTSDNSQENEPETAKETIASCENGNGTGFKKSSDSAQLGDVMGMISPLLSRSSKSRETAKHEALLCALKPYLSDSKKNAVDSILKVAKIGDVIEAFGIDKKKEQI